MDHKRIEFNSIVPCDYVEVGPKDAQDVFLLLHGFYQSGELILQQMAPALPKDARLIAPNGPFPQAKRRGDDWDIAFAWYFFSPKQKAYFVDTHIPCKFLKNFCGRIGIKDQNLTIVGFSQGGYLAPYVAKEFSNTKRVIGIGCEFRSSRIPQDQFSFRIDQIHGELDPLVSCQDAEKQFDEMLSKCPGGKFNKIAGQGHDWNDLFSLKLKEIVAGKIIH